ncbi:Protein-L-isoaspartate O-methyltransferase 2, variant 3 [Lathyrus oleraceus]|uniref:Protein-L-isoaspartate O-methyltransferase 2, variant 3 n=1 Tax=Pisum sativum TaxID=3888 RepID=A0A9D4WT50_PEA|nr:Protein-L-isoaspartate O-methyltransferase 2, variant 3 [Pisum sativum]
MNVGYYYHPFSSLAHHSSVSCYAPITRTSQTLLHHHRPVSISFSFFQNPNFYTGNTIFFKMQRFCSVSGKNKNKAMVERLQHFGVIMSNKVAEVMETVDRALFVPSGSASPYDDSPVAIGYNATISAPHMHATCLQLLEENLQPGMHALDIGSGI